MRKDMLGKTLVLGVIFLFIGVGVQPISGIQIDNDIIKSTGRGNILYVGGNGTGNYSKIQDAIDNASDGDTVFVYNGTYYENLRIVKDINLFGEDMDKTIIDGRKEDTAVKIGGYVNFSGFTVQTSEKGIMNLNLPPPDDIYKIIMFGNIIKDNRIGISIVGNLNHIIHDNTILNNELGIDFFFADNCFVKDNNFINNNEHAYFENLLFFQFLPRIKWNGNYWDDWKMKIPRPIIGQLSLIIILRPGEVIRIAEIPRFNFDWHPAKEPYNMTTTQEYDLV